MKIVVERSALQKILADAQSVVERSNTVPILNNVRLEAFSDSLRITASNMSMEVTDRVPAAIQEGGATTVPALVLNEIWQGLPDGSEVLLDGTDSPNRLMLKCGSIDFQFSCLPATDFPVISDPPEYPHNFRILAQDLRNMIDKSQFATSTDENRKNLNGLFFHTAGTNQGTLLRSVATDGHRLARIDVGDPGESADVPGTILPKRNVVALRKIIADYQGDIEIDVSDAQARFKFGSLVLKSKLIDDRFPDYNRVIPHDNDKIFAADRLEFIKAASRMMAIAEQPMYPIKLSVENSSMTLSVNGSMGAGKEVITTDWGGPLLEIGFNGKYLLDALQALDGEGVEFRLSNPNQAAVINAKDDQRSLHVLMPIRV